MKQLFKLWLLGTCLYCSSQVKAQNNESETADLMNLSLEELMNVDIVSASKKSESLFDAPLSASVLTREEIKKAGATSIMEAFRLMPGLIVREQSNGNFDVHLRGLDNVPPNSVLVNAANTTTLVMIDNRPVYNYLQGGTLWETLPIDINDIERIEVVRGAVSALYGPNAVSGVINIITRRTEKDGLYALANTQFGSNKTIITNAAIGYQPNNKFSAIISGNFQERNRDEISYYRVATNEFMPVADSLYNSSTSGNAQSYIPNPDGMYPEPDLAMKKYGVNAFINYNLTEKTNVSVSAGMQDSRVQNAYYENLITPLSTFLSNTQYANVKANAYNFSAQLSYLNGTQNPALGTVGGKYDFNTLDASLEYSWTIKKLVLKPGLTYRKAVYDDTKYWDVELKEGVISGRKEVLTYATSLRAEYTLFNDKLRLIGGVRSDKFNFPDKYYFSYQLAANYKLNDKHMFRVVQSRANRSPFVYDTYLDKTFRGLQQVAPGFFIPTETDVLGNKELKLVTSDMSEMGYRVKVAENLQLDVEAFRTVTKDYADFIQEKSVIVPGSPVETKIEIQNLPATVVQVGTTISANYIVNKIQIKPFITIQETKLKDYSSYYNTEEVNPVNNISSGKGTTLIHKGTPSVYGGAFINYQIHPKFNINLNTYYYSTQTFYHRNNTTYRDGVRGVDHLASKLILNARISYKPVKQLDIFVSGRNLSGDHSREFYRTDKIGSTFLAGLNFEF